MEAWKDIGGFIGSHMAFISPTCVVLAVLFPDQLSLMKPAVPFLFAFMTFQGALSNTFQNLRQALRHPAPLLAILGVSAVLMPVLACALAQALFGFDQAIVCGIVLEYSVPVAVVASMWVSMFGGDASLALATTLASTVLAPFSIPLALQLLLGQTVEVDALGMMEEMLLVVALPSLAGTALNNLSRGRAAREASPVLAPAAKIALVAVVLSNSTGVAPYVRSLTPTLAAVTLFILVFAASGYAWGLALALLWRRPREQVVTMTFQCGMRNISAGAVIAAEYFPGETMFPVIIGTLFQQVLAATFGTVMDKLVLPRLDRGR